MFDSIRLRLTFWYVGVLALVIIVFAGLTYFLVVKTLTRQTDENLLEMARNLKVTIDFELSEASDHAAIEKVIPEEVAESRFHDFTFLVTTADNSRQIASTSDKNDLNAAISSDNSDLALKTKKIGNTDFRIYQMPVKFGGETYNLYVTRDLEDQKRFLNRLSTSFLFAIPLLIGLAGLGGYFLARKSLAPVALMSARAAKISATNLHERLPVMNEKDELGNLAQTFNKLLLRLEESFEQQRRFMADASHELRTPLAIVRGESEVALSKNDRPVGDLRESLAIVNDESKRLTRIVEDLFTLARADAGQFRISDGKIYLDELLADCIRAAHILAAQRNIKFEFQTVGEMPMRGDEPLLHRLFINLLDNAIKYNREGGKIAVTTEVSETSYHVLISDTGTGISDDEKQKVFERFYRADKARSRQMETTTSGAGLGLSISLWIVELHQGSIEIVSSNDAGTIFAVNLPFSK